MTYKKGKLDPYNLDISCYNLDDTYIENRDVWKGKLDPWNLDTSCYNLDVSSIQWE